METTRIRILLELLEKEIQKIINRPKRKFKRDPGPIDEELLF